MAQSIEKYGDNRTRGALVLIGVGLLFLAGPSVMWPLFILLPGAGLLYLAHTGSKGLSALAIPGMLISGTGALLFVQNFTGYWESWSYAWTLYGVFLGMGMMIFGRRIDDRSLVNVGRWFVRVGLAGFLIFGAFMTVILHPQIIFMLGLAFLVAGGYLLWSKDNHDTTHIFADGKRKNTRRKNRVQVTVDAVEQIPVPVETAEKPVVVESEHRVPA